MGWGKKETNIDCDKYIWGKHGKMKRINISPLFVCLFIIILFIYLHFPDQRIYYNVGHMLTHTVSSKGSTVM